MTAITPDLLRAVFIFFVCLLLALLEIQIEGSEGWAKNLPTWRGQPSWARPNSLFFAALRRAFGLLSGGNQLTGYHLTMLAFFFTLMQFPVLFSAAPLSTFWQCLGYFIISTVSWDFLWFVFNPAYGVRRFRKQFIAWHPRWLFFLPLPYPGGYLLGMACIAHGRGGLTLAWRSALTAACVHLILTFFCIAAVELGRRSTPH